MTEDSLRARLEQLGGDKEALIAELIAVATTDDELRTELIHTGARVTVGRIFIVGRRLPVKAAIEARRRFMDEYRLFGGNITLAEATQADLIRSAAQHEQLANTHLGEATFERAVSRGLSGGKRVHQVYTDKRLQKMREHPPEAVAA